ncbi:MAG TPA: hypothetical protein VMD76_04380 [Candidatus Sulfotelmatobacter sp.]|nr:hypothetical protein [Candidatus Sulfotelmatobacter sp.]
MRRKDKSAAKEEFKQSRAANPPSPMNHENPATRWPQLAFHPYIWLY